MKKIVVQTMLVLLLISMSTFTLNVQPIKATPTTIVVPDDYPTIQEAINHANMGDTIFVRSGTYVENVVVNKAISLLGESRETTVIDGGKTGDTIHIIGTYGTSVIGFTIINGWPYGVYTYLSGAPNISDNIISDNLYGIRIEQSGLSNITGNLIINNRGAISHWYSGASIIIANLITKNTDGIEIAYSQKTALRNNTMTENNYSFGVWSYGGPSPYGSINDFVHDIDTSNTVDGRPVYYFVNRKNEQVPKDAGYVGVINSTDIVVRDLHISKNGQGVMLAFANDSTIQNVTISNSENGIRLVYSNNNTIKDNTVSENWHGIYLRKSQNNTIYHNNFIGNTVFQATIDESGNNLWDDSYPSGGNYWSDYIDVDVYHGVSQNIAGSDGIGDTPYVIDANNIDHYPLMSPWTPTIKATVDFQPDTLNLGSKGKLVACYIELPEGNDVANIDVSTIKLNATVSAELKPTAIGDYDNDAIPDLMVKFDAAKVTEYILNSVSMTGKFVTVSLTITGKLDDGTPFQGSDTIKILPKS